VTNDLTPEQITALAGDRRRAAAAVVHYAQHNLDGINEVLREAAEIDRVTPLILALLDVYDQMVPELRTDLGMSFLSSHIMRVAGMEQGQR
jgi:hypothetical protein